jgi:glycerol-3-phosphate O-acyltransferase / dihydroxyacetone phosphate acyltransferase
MLYRVFRALARLTLHLFFRRIEVEGHEHVPAAGPVLFVPNHTNALVDPLLIVIALRRRVTITAKNVLGNNPLLGLLMSGLGVVTFHRREDAGKGAQPRQNLRSLARCREVLKEGGSLCIFPEGVSHSDAKMRPFRSGAARIALDFVKEDENPGGLQIVPVGLLYTQKDQFRSDVWLRFGIPVDAAAWLQENPQGDALLLTQEIRRRVEHLTLNFENRRESLILGWAAEIVATGAAMPAPLGHPEPALAEDFGLVVRLQTGYRTLMESSGEEMQQLSTRVRRYHTELRRLGIDPAEVYLPIHPGRAALFLIRELELLVVGAPLALFGAINHVLPYYLIKWIARALSKDKDHWATNVVYPSFLVLPFFYVFQLTAVWLWLPALWAGLYSVALPYTGYYALLYRDRAGSTLRRTRTFCHFLCSRSRQEGLAREGSEIVAHIRALGDRL